MCIRDSFTKLKVRGHNVHSLIIKPEPGTDDGEPTKVVRHISIAGFATITAAITVPLGA